MNFLIMTLLIAYSLFFLGFSVVSYELIVSPSTEGAAQRPTKEINVIASVDTDITPERDGLESAESDSGIAVQYWKKEPAKVLARHFICTDNYSCKTLICTGGPIYDILNELEYFINWCRNIFFDVILEDCSFYENTISSHTFSGNFKMSTLTIRNCELDTIVDNAFKYQSVNKLKNLTFVGVQLKVLNAQTFNGLEAVENFQLFNVLTQATSPLNANHFLQPMAASLSNLVLQQTEESHSAKTIYDPTAWLGGNSDTVYNKLLYVDLSGTKFNDTLNGNTFAKLLAVHELRLANCNLSTIAENVFADILPTLKSLDLRYNQLQTLDGGFLATALVKGVNIEFGLNLWNCDCDNVEIIEYMKQVENSAATETVCATPMELQGIPIGDAQMRCDNTTTIITTITTTVATSKTTTIMTDTTDEITIETTETAPDATPISSTSTINNSTTSLSAVRTTMSVTPDDLTDETTESSSKTSPTMSTTPISKPTSPVTNTMPTTEVDTTEETTESSPKTSQTPSATPTKNSTLLTLPPTTVTPSTAQDTNGGTRESSPNTSTIPSTTPINHLTTKGTTDSTSKTSPTPSTSVINHPTTAVDKTEKTTTSSPKTSPTSPITPVNNSTMNLSPSTTTMSTTADDTNEETTESGNIIITTTTTTIYSTTLSSSSGAASLHRWRW